MTEAQRLALEYKLEQGTITKRELRRLKKSQEQGRSSAGYAEKQQSKLYKQ